MVAEMVTEKELQPRAFSILPLMWAFGSTLGPAFGGFFAKPAEKLPSLFGKNQFFIRFPFALPNLIAVVFFACGLFVGILFLKETLETKKDKPDYGLYLGEKLVACVKGRPKKIHRNSNCEDDEAAGALLSAVSTTPTQSFDNERKPTSKPSQPPPRFREIFTSQSTINLISYTFLALHAVSFDQLLPVFLHHPPQTLSDPVVSLPFKFSGGFGLDSSRIGTLFTLFGICSGLVQFLIFPPFARRFGVLNCYKACSVTLPLVYLLIPFPALIQDPITQQVAVFSIMVVKCFCAVFAFPCTTILLTNSALSLRILGTLNGIATSLSAAGRGVGPMLSGALFTWGVKHGYVITPWWTLAAIAALGIIPVWCLEEMDGLNSLQESKDDDGEEERLLAINDEDQEDRAIIGGGEVVLPHEVEPTERSPLLGSTLTPKKL
jgi:Major Facilitator Superfamily